MRHFAYLSVFWVKKETEDWLVGVCVTLELNMGPRDLRYVSRMDGVVVVGFGGVWRVWERLEGSLGYGGFRGLGAWTGLG